MRQNENLIRYHLESVIELAREEGLSTLEHLVTMAVLENFAPNDVLPIKAEAPSIGPKRAMEDA